MRLLTAAVLLPALLSALVSCGETSDAAYREAAELAVRNAVLTLDDLPDRWAPSDLDIEGYPELELTGDCAPLSERGAGFEGEVATSSSEPFAGPSDQQLTASVSVFTDSQTAEEAMREAGDLVFQCEDQLIEAFERAIRDAASDLGVGDLIGDIDPSLERGSFAAFGDETAAYHLHAGFSALVLDLEVNGDIIVIRDGPVTAILTYFVLGDIDTQEEESLAATLARKLAKAEESLAN